jgi:hypothetical protein
MVLEHVRCVSTEESSTKWRIICLKGTVCLKNKSILTSLERASVNFVIFK